MKKTVSILLLLALLLTLCACAASSKPAAPVPTPAQTKRPAPTPVPKPVTPVPKPTATPPVTPAGSRYLPPTPSPVPLNPLGQDIADFALEFLGSKYKYGGKDPETGFDCSGLVYYVYGHFGIPLYRTAADQAKNGEHVPPEEIAPGDIILFYRGGWIGHAGIYLGDGEYIHSMNEHTGVVISPTDEISTKTEIRRVFAEIQQE